MDEIVAVIGNNSAPEETCAIAERLGGLLMEHGYRLVCGGMAGVMEAVSRGASESPHHRPNSILGILPVMERELANRYLDWALPTPMGIARNPLVVTASQAVVAIAGGSGTLSELSYAWQYGKPIIALDVGWGWSHELAGRVLDDRREDPILKAGTPEEAVELLGKVLRS